jgi:hypothetical protein
MNNPYRFHNGNVDFGADFDKMFGPEDSRLKYRKMGEVYGTPNPLLPAQLWEPVFCWNCGTKAGHVTKGTPFRYMCQDCVTVYGHPPLPMVPGTENL